jgi:nucleoside-diphosphate-sugar epimerase
MSRLVAVTGGTGFVALELIKQLLELGYHVRATVRDKGATDKVQPLLALGAALPGTLELVEADLLRPGSFDAAFAGCHYIFHTASPFFIDAKDPQTELIAPAVEGTRNVMASAAKARPARVILTSSCAAVKGMNNPAPPSNGPLYTEADWNETSTIESGEAYWVSKVQAERAAWEAAKESGLDLVTILPDFIMGPLISAREDQGTSAGFMTGWAEGAAMGGAPVFADVRDVAKAHILAAETAEASGRYIVAASQTAPPHLVSSWLRERFPEYAFHVPSNDDKEEPKAVVDNSKVQRELGLALTPVRRTVVDMVATLYALGLAKPKPL